MSTSINQVNISIEPQGKRIELQAGEPLRDVLFREGIEFPCGGKGRCGACRVRLLEGVMSISDAERDYFSRSELEQGWRFACRARPTGDLRLHIEQWDTPILDGHGHVELSGPPGFGVAVDLGTTTIVAQLLNLGSGDVLGVGKCLNPQCAYGADLLNRVEYGLQAEGFDKLVSLVRDAIGQLVQNLLADAAIKTELLRRIIIVGNTVMHHLFCGIDIEPLSRAPFVSPDDGLQVMSTGELGWSGVGNAPVWLLPCLGGFVGGDLLAGILATNMHVRSDPVLLVDLGTNGEIVVGNRDRILCASTAAGPAFEGGGIRRGMYATAGAIDAVDVVDDKLLVRVIGKRAARGLCGSGLVDAIAGGLELGWISPSGRITRAGGQIDLGPRVELTQNDVRQLQLAKAAIAAGIQVLLEEYAIAAGAIESIYLAGAFGNYINIDSARRIGLLQFDEQCIEAVGNTALLGAKLALCNMHSEEEFAAVLATVQHVVLADNSRFHEQFIRGTVFPDALCP